MARRHHLLCLLVAAAALLLVASAKKSGDVTELQIGVKRKIILDPAMDSSANFYKRMLQKHNWLAQKRKQLKYPDFSMKDAPVPPRLPVPKCVCGEPAEIIQSTHPDTAARAYYMCGQYMPEMRCHFFQWIDGPEMYDRAFIQQEYMLNYSVRAENFSRWKPYVPDEEAPKDPSKLPSVIHIDDKGKAHANDMEDFDTPARRGHSRNKGKGKAHEAEPGRHSVSGRPGVIRIHDDMDDFETPARRGQSRDKGKGKAHAAEPGRHSVSGRPGAIYMDDGTDDFDIPAQRGQSGDKGKAPSTETHRRRDKAPLLWRRGDK